MDFILEAVENLKYFFSDYIHHLDLLIEYFKGLGKGIISFFMYVWFLCIPNEITDIVFFFIMSLIFFAFIKKAR